MIHNTVFPSSPQSAVRSPQSPVHIPCIAPTDNESYASMTLHDPPWYTMRDLGVTLILLLKQ